MQTLAAIFFGGTALFATMLIVLNPVPRILEAMRGKTPEQFKASLDTWKDGTNPFLGLAMIVGLTLYLVANVTFGTAVLPLIAIVAITNGLGYSFLGYAALLLSAVNIWKAFRGLRVIATSIATPEPPAVAAEPPVQVLDRDGAVLAAVPSTTTASAPPLKLAHPVVLAARRAFYGGLTAAYLWYLFLVAIGVAS